MTWQFGTDYMECPLNVIDPLVFDINNNYYKNFPRQNQSARAIFGDFCKVRILSACAAEPVSPISINVIYLPGLSQSNVWWVLLRIKMSRDGGRGTRWLQVQRHGRSGIEVVTRDPRSCRPLSPGVTSRTSVPRTRAQPGARPVDLYKYFMSGPPTRRRRGLTCDEGLTRPGSGHKNWPVVSLDAVRQVAITITW